MKGHPVIDRRGAAFTLLRDAYQDREQRFTIKGLARDAGLSESKVGRMFKGNADAKKLNPADIARLATAARVPLRALREAFWIDADGPVIDGSPEAIAIADRLRSVSVSSLDDVAGLLALAARLRRSEQERTG